MKDHMMVRKTLEEGEWLLSKKVLFENVDIKNFIGLCHAHLSDLMRYDRSEMKEATRVPPVWDDGYGVSPDRVVGSQFRTHEIHPENISSNAGLIARLRDLRTSLKPRGVNLLLLDVGIFIRAIKVPLTIYT